jgi:pyridoxal phosphate enzyme (YggS family)
LTTVADRFAAVADRVERAALEAGRDPSEVTVVAVSKTFGADAVAQALAAGVTDFGENRAQELRAKAMAVEAASAAEGPRGPRWHFIGHLQTNKVRHVVGVELIHSVDRVGVAEAIARRASDKGITQDVLIEVNVAGEASKQGIDPDLLPGLVEEVSSLQGVGLRGLMTMPPLPRQPEDSRPYYKELAALRDALAERVPGATWLSMGMTRDFEVAISEGATHVRVGEAIFGERQN